MIYYIKVGMEYLCYYKSEAKLRMSVNGDIIKLL